jgi:dTDP-4-dehydrorhamnose 3,5-epimerase-like enzyme
VKFLDVSCGKQFSLIDGNVLWIENGNFTSELYMNDLKDKNPVAITAENKYIMYVPNTYAHGFTSLEDDTEIEYFTDNVYCYEAAKSFRFDDKALIDESGAQGIDWTMGGKVNLNLSIRSDKNSNAPDFKYCEF